MEAISIKNRRRDQEPDPPLPGQQKGPLGISAEDNGGEKDIRIEDGPDH